MLELVNKLSARFKSRFTKNTAAVNPKPGAPGRGWSHGEIRLLLACEQSRRQWQAKISGTQATHHAEIHGIDFTTNQLLLSPLQPALTVGSMAMATDVPFWLRLPLSGCEYRICVAAREWLPGHGVLVDIVTADFFRVSDSGKALHPRVELGHSTSSFNPAAQLRLSSGQVLKGKVLNLSEDSAEILLHARDAAALRLSQTGVNCAITFNDSFRLFGCGRTQQPARLPATKSGLSYRVKLEFTHMDADHQLQLRAFLRACAPNANRAA